MSWMASQKFRDKDLIVFDLDGTLTPSKSSVQPDMARVLAALLAQKKVAVIGGGKYSQFKKQLVLHLRVTPELLRNLFLFPTVGTSFYRYHHGWKPVYEKSFPLREKKKIKAALKTALKTIHYQSPQRLWGRTTEDRHTQITFSALGQRAPLKAKEKWNKKSDIRTPLIKELRRLLPECSVHQGGLTSVDITEKGIDKAYGIRQMQKHLRIPERKMLFIGDDLKGHGNDAPVKKTGVECIAVRGPKETKQIIKETLKSAVAD
jgi:HAD superfamily hydrolase (TIGR01484 family)